jgi:hypothetical protein
MAIPDCQAIGLLCGTLQDRAAAFAWLHSAFAHALTMNHAQAHDRGGSGGESTGGSWGKV